MTQWRAQVRDRVLQLDRQVRSLDGHDAARAAQLREALAKFESDHGDGNGRGFWRRVGERFSGNDVNEAWSTLHAVEEEIDDALVEADSGAVYRDIDDHMDRALPPARVREIQARLDAAKLDERTRRSIYAQALVEAHDAEEALHDSQRATERGLLTLSSLFAVAAGILVILQATVFSPERIVPAPSEGSAASATAFLTLVMLFGMLGGAFSALTALYLSDKFQDVRWYDPRPSLTLAKVVAGLWTAVFGVLAVASGLVVGVYTSTASAVLLAFLFGYGQQAVTRYFDRKLDETLQGSTPTTSGTGTG